MGAHAGQRRSSSARAASPENFNTAHGAIIMSTKNGPANAEARAETVLTLLVLLIPLLVVAGLTGWPWS